MDNNYTRVDVLFTVLHPQLEPWYRGPLESMLPAYCSHLKLRYTRFTVLLFILLRSHILNLPAQYLHLKEFYWRITTHIISTPFTGKQHATINLTTLQYTQLNHSKLRSRNCTFSFFSHHPHHVIFTFLLPQNWYGRRQCTHPCGRGSLGCSFLWASVHQ